MVEVVARRLSDRPVIAPGAVEGYGPIFNAGLLYVRGTFYLFARGVRTGYRRNRGDGPRFEDYVSDVLLFESPDGRTYRFRKVLTRGSHEGVFSYEDPRVQWVWSGGRRHLLMSYTDLPDPVSGLSWRIGLHGLVVRRGTFLLNHDSGRVVGPLGPPDKDAVLFNLEDGRLGFLHRIHPSIQLAVFDSLEDLLDPPTGYWERHLEDLDAHTILRPSPGSLGVGAGAPPLRTEEGMLLFYHERRADGTYTANVALLDKRTGRPLSNLPFPILEPRLPWERWGDVDNVIFVQGAQRLADGTLYLTYGAADRAVGAAIVEETLLLRALHRVA